MVIGDKLRNTLCTLKGSNLTNVMGMVHSMDCVIDKKSIIELFLLAEGEIKPVEIRGAPDGESLVIGKNFPNPPVLLGEYGETVLASLSIEGMNSQSRLDRIHIVEYCGRVVALEFFGNCFVFSISNIGDDLILDSKESILKGERVVLNCL